MEVILFIEVFIFSTQYSLDPPDLKKQSDEDNDGK